MRSSRRFRALQVDDTALKAAGTVPEDANTAPKKQNVSLTDDDDALKQESARFYDKDVALKIVAWHYASFNQENITPRRDNTEYPEGVANLKKVRTDVVQEIATLEKNAPGQAQDLVTLQDTLASELHKHAVESIVLDD